MLYKVWRSSNISENTKNRIFNSTFKSALLCCYETWKITRNISNKLQVFIHTYSEHRYNFLGQNTISNLDLCNAFYEQPAVQQIKYRKLVENTLHRPKSSIYKYALNCNPQVSRKQGCRVTNWRLTVWKACWKKERH